MDKQYDAKILRKLQLAQCRILEDFIKLCNDHGLRYFIFAGCAIGVERHQGFIPWDDDIDIGMLRDDYDKFLQIAKRDYSDKYSILEISEDSTFPFFNAEFKKNGTKNVPEIFKNSNVDMGIDIAVYPFDNVSDDFWKRRKQLIAVFFWHKIKILREFGRPALHIGGWKEKAVSGVCMLIHAILCLFHVRHELINRKYMENATKYNRADTKMVSCFFARIPTKCMIKRSDLFPLVSKRFEYLTVDVPKKNHEYLIQMYGDYLQLPPVEKQKNHFPYILEFGDFENIDIQNEQQGIRRE